MPDYFFHASLFLAEFGFLGPLIIFGIYCVDKKVFINVLIMCILSAFINAYLKSIWRIPLDPALGLKGWAFPSGHTQFNLVVWLVLIYQIRKLWVALIAIAITVMSYFSMLHFHYHNWYDIYAGIFFGALVFLAFVLWDYIFKGRQLELASVCLIISVVMLAILPYQFYGYSWLFLCLGMETGLLMYLVLERLGYIHIIPKLDRSHVVKFLLMLVIIYVIKSMRTDIAALIYLKGLAITAVSLLYASERLPNKV
jgi:hypothetical protein